MAILTIRDFDEGLKAKLGIRATEYGRSMEAEVRTILASVLTKPTSDPGMGREFGSDLATWTTNRWSKHELWSF